MDDINKYRPPQPDTALLLLDILCDIRQQLPETTSAWITGLEICLASFKDKDHYIATGRLLGIPQDDQVSARKYEKIVAYVAQWKAKPRRCLSM